MQAVADAASVHRSTASRALNPATRHLVAAEHTLTAEERSISNGHLGGILWLTGLSGSGKSTLAMGLERELFRKGVQICALDGDAVRQGLNADLGFSPEHRSENIRRVAQVARLFAESGMVVVTAFISPTRADRAAAREIGGPFFHEVHIAADLDTCEGRDAKGLYKKARAGLIPQFTGVSAPYEAPLNPELVIDTAGVPADACLAELARYTELTLIRPVRRGAKVKLT